MNLLQIIELILMSLDRRCTVATVLVIILTCLTWGTVLARCYLFSKFFYHVLFVTALCREEISWTESGADRCNDRKHKHGGGADNKWNTNLFTKLGFISRLWIMKSWRGFLFNSTSPTRPERWVKAAYSFLMELKALLISSFQGL